MHTLGQTCAFKPFLISYSLRAILARPLVFPAFSFFLFLAKLYLLTQVHSLLYLHQNQRICMLMQCQSVASQDLSAVSQSCAIPVLSLWTNPHTQQSQQPTSMGFDLLICMTQSLMMSLDNRSGWQFLVAYFNCKKMKIWVKKKYSQICAKFIQLFWKKKLEAV